MLPGILRRPRRLLPFALPLFAELITIPAWGWQGSVPATNQERPWWYIPMAAVLYGLWWALRDVSRDIGPLEVREASKRLGRPIANFWHRTLWRRLLGEYFLLLGATLIFAWVLGFLKLNHPMRSFSRIAAFPIAIMLSVYCYKRFFKAGT